MAESNNSERYGNFLRALKMKCEGKKVLVVQDNLKIHHARVLHEIYDENFQKMMLPPYSCVLNPIERLWSILKRKWTQHLFNFSEQVGKERINRSIQVRTIIKLKELIGRSLFL